MPENILLITIDSLRADRVRDENIDTPAHDKLSSEGTVYENAFSQGPFTTFSMPSFFTSRYPSGLQYTEFSESTVGVYIDNEPTIATELQKEGYETAGFHSNPLLSNLFGFDRGFDEFEAGLPLSESERFGGRSKILIDKLLRIVRKHPYLPAEKINERALQWLDTRETDSPFFLWLHYMDVHGPYIAKSGFHYFNKYRAERLWRKAVTNPEDVTDSEREKLEELYHQEIEYTDENIHRLFEELERRDIWDDTAVVMTADHGECFGEHGTFSHPHLLYDELTHVPLIVREPEGISKEIELPVELLDVAPTLISKAGGTIPESFSGEVLPNKGKNSNALAISEADLTPEYNGSVRGERYRYIRNEVAGKEELYDIIKDPDEQDNIADGNGEIKKEFAVILDEHIDSEGRDAGEEREITRTTIGEKDVQDRLQDLGYLE